MQRKENYVIQQVTEEQPSLQMSDVSAILLDYDSDDSGDSDVVIPLPVDAASDGAPVLLGDEPQYRLHPGIRLTCRLIPLAVGLTEASGLYLGLKRTPAAMKWGTVSFAFATETAMANEFVIKNIDATYHAIRSGALPASWPNVTGKKVALAATIATLVTGYGAFSYGFESYYFVDGIPSELNIQRPPAWIIPSAITATLIGIGAVTAEGVETYRSFRSILSNSRKEYCNRFSRVVSPLTAGVLGLFGSTNNAVSSYVSLTSILGSAKGKSTAFAATSSLNLIGSMCMEAPFARDSLDAFFASISTQCPSAKQTISMLLATVGAGLIAYAQYGLAEFFMRETLEDFNIPHADSAATVLASGTAAHESLVAVSNLYPIFSYLIDKIEAGIGKIANYLTKDENDKDDIPDANATKEELEPFISGDEPAPASYDSEELEEEHKTTRCSIM